MNPISRIALACLILLALASATLAEEPTAAPATLKIQVDRPGAKVSPTLWGIFFEEINCAGDGGLYAELVRNRSFEDSDKPDHWLPVTSGAGKVELNLDAGWPATEFNRHSLKVKLAPAGDGRVGVANGGFWGIAVVKNAVYNLSFSARGADRFEGPLTVTLENANGKVYASAKVDGLAADWKKFQATLTSSETDPSARLVIVAEKPGALWLDMVSLFPQKTFKDRPNGLRPDLAEMLAGLRPSFVRFPGGCWVEGDVLKFASRWKRTIGDPVTRWNQWNIWAYHSTNGLGYHEYLQMCEDLKAEPLFVINVGMSHRENVPMDQMGEWVQDALDAIEYANGPADSKWGSLRAKAGHPKPFGMKYIEIGNENGGPAYQERYALFYDAIKAKYPDMTLISDCPTDKRPSDIVDEHYYNSPEFFMQNAHRYDTYKRTGPKIYVGEYAVTANAGKGHLKAALGEAAFMTGMERNSDVVAMASYAPLFVNVNHRRWNPNLIDFDSSRVYGIPSYYVQQMFSQNSADVVLPLTLEAQPLPAKAEVKRGAIGLGTWATQAEYKDIKVIQGDKVVFKSDFDKGIEGWKPGKGQWKVKDGALVQTASVDDCRIVAGDPSWGDYTYTLKARKLGGSEGFLIMFQVRDEGNWIWWNLGGWGNQRHALEQCTGGSKGELGQSVPGGIQTGRWYDIRVELKGSRVRCYLDGKLVHDVAPGQQLPMYAVAGLAEKSGEVIVKVVNTGSAARDTEITLSGAKEIEPAGTAIVLTSARPDDENSLEEPLKVSPKTQSIGNAGRTFHYTFPAYSLTILRMKTK